MAAGFVAVLLAGLALSTLSGVWPASSSDSGGRPNAPTFVGSEICAGCHQTEAERWRFSQHRRAVDRATEKSVLANFNDTTFDYFGVHSRFFRKNGRFLVETDGPDGKLAEFEIKYTFGVEPLQQYLIEFSDGRIQALSIAWDTRPKEQGGQRWFHLYGDEEIKHDDILHWTRLNQNWNFMCAECHSTGVRKNYDAAHDRFATTWSEISVGCEACHGQGSAHVSWARAKQGWWPFGKSEDRSKGLLARFDERRDVMWRPDASTGNPQRSFPAAVLRKEVETCGRCHARRGEFAEDWIPGRWLSDTHVVTPLARGLYYADGQMRDGEEVYNYGPFKQSRMFAAGVTCSDCHDPHSAALRTPGDSTCLQCHSPEKYAAAKHHHHEGVSPPVACSSCHMPARTYMVIDRRHDHSFRVPRPDLSAKFATPNACNDCHRDKSSEWAAAAVEGWFGSDPVGFQTYVQALHSAWTDQPDAESVLTAVATNSNAPPFARASVLTELASYPSASGIELARTALSDSDPMVRIGALDMLENALPSQIWPLVSPLLDDPVRGVRIRAAEVLAPVPTGSQPPADRAHFEHAASEFIAAQRLNADRPEARTALGNFYARRGLVGEAETEYRAALRLNPQFAPAAINLSDLYRQLRRDADGEAVLRAAMVSLQADAELHYALGLTLARLKRPDEALDEFRHAAALKPESPRYAYVLAVAMHSGGHVDEAIALLKQNLTRHPNDGDTLLALINFSRDAGNLVDALLYAEELAAMRPGDRDLKSLISELRHQVK